MTDEQIYVTIREIMDKLYDPKNGFRALERRVVKFLRAYGLKDDEIQQRGMALKRRKLSKMAAKYGLENADLDIQKFKLSGRDIVENRVFFSCGTAAKAFCYINSQLPPSKRLDVKVLLSTDTEHLVDGMSGHTLPMVRFADGRWRAIEPQNDPDKQDYIIQDDIQVGGTINHILPGIAKNGRSYKILHIVSPDYLENELSDFEVFLKHSVERTQQTSMRIGELNLIAKKMNLAQYAENSRRIYEFCKRVPNDNNQICVFRYRKQSDTLDYFYLAVLLDGDWYVLNTSRPFLTLRKMQDTEKGPGFQSGLKLEQKMSPDEYIRFYNNVIMKSKSREG